MTEASVQFSRRLAKSATFSIVSVFSTVCAHCLFCHLGSHRIAPEAPTGRDDTLYAQNLVPRVAGSATPNAGEIQLFSLPSALVAAVFPLAWFSVSRLARPCPARVASRVQ